MKVKISIKGVIPIDNNDFCSALAALDLRMAMTR
jgi:hypothetical protein